MPAVKKEQAPALTPATVAAGLAYTESSQKQAALTQLAAAGAAFSTQQAITDILQHGIPPKLVELLQQTDKSVRLLACRQIATYAASGPAHPLQQAVASKQTAQVLWSVLQAYAEAEGAIKAALADPVAVKAAAPKKLPGAKDPVDPDEWLPGPSKYLLEAALRALSSLAACSTAAATGADFAQLESSGGCIADEGSEQSPSTHLCSWMCSQEASSMVALLRHPSSRVQMRAARLALQLARSEQWCSGCAAAGGVSAALHLAGLLEPSTDTPTSTSSAGGLGPAVYISALQLLMRLVRTTHAAVAAVALCRQQVLDSLMATLLAAGSAVPAAPAAAGGGASKGKAADATKQGGAAKDPVLLVQQAAAELLALLCCRDSQLCQLLVTKHGLTVLTSMLPDPPPAPASPSGQQQQQEGDELGTSSDTVPSSSKAGVVPPLALGGDAGVAGSGHVPRSPHQAAGTPRGRGATPPHDSYAGPLSSRPTTPGAAPAAAGFVPPGTKLFNPELQAKLLHVVAAVLSQPGMVSTVLEACPVLPRLLLHVSAAAPAPISCTGPVSTPGPSNVAAATAEIGPTEQQAAAAPAAAKAGAGVPAAAAAATAAAKQSTQAGTPRGSLTAKGGLPPVQIGQAGGSSNSGAATPHKTMGPASGALANKGPEAPAVPDPLGPPYAICTKAAALACLRHLSHDKQGAALLAMQLTATAPSASSTAADTPAAAGQTPREQQQQQQSVKSGGTSCGASMLQQVLADLQALGGASHTDSASEGISAAGTESGAASAAAAEPQSLPDLEAGLLDDAACFVEGLLASLDQQQLKALPLTATLQVLAKHAASHPTAHQLQQSVMRALLALPEDAFVPPPRPPLPSPPPTPPPPPLPTSQFAWDALDRTSVIDGAVLVDAH